MDIAYRLGNLNEALLHLLQVANTEDRLEPKYSARIDVAPIAIHHTPFASPLCSEIEASIMHILSGSTSLGEDISVVLWCVALCCVVLCCVALCCVVRVIVYVLRRWASVGLGDLHVLLLF